MTVSEDRYGTSAARPTRVGSAERRTYRGELVSLGPVSIDLVVFDLPDGTAGRGFLNGELSWSFFGDEVDRIDDAQLLVAYCGWAWLRSRLLAGDAEGGIDAPEDEERFLAMLDRDGVRQPHITARYRVGKRELFEYRGRQRTGEVVGAGDLDSDTRFPADDPRCALPAIYFHLGPQIIRHMRG